MHRKIKRYGWRRDELDERDHSFETFWHETVRFSPVYSLRGISPSSYDQLDLGSCVGNGVARVVQLQRRHQKLVPDWVPSRLAIYYWARLLDGTEAVDAGAQIRNGIKAITKFGAPPEADWIYNPNKFAVAPDAAAVQAGLLNQALRYYRVQQTVTWIKTALMQGFGVVYGFNVYPQFESNAAAVTGIIQMPRRNATPIGGHCQVIVGWNDTKTANGVTGYWECANSWGSGWGDNGYDWMPYGYLTSTRLASDFWTVQLVEPGT
jgi:C1A family cysteine protease